MHKNLGSYTGFGLCYRASQASQVVLVVKKPPATAGDAGDVGSIPGLGRFPGVGNGNLLQYSCLENSMDRGTWSAIVHGVAKRWTRPNMHTCPHAHEHIHRVHLGK